MGPLMPPVTLSKPPNAVFPLSLKRHIWRFLCVSGKPGPRKGQGTKSTQNPQHYGQLPTAVLFALSTKKSLQIPQSATTLPTTGYRTTGGPEVQTLPPWRYAKLPLPSTCRFHPVWRLLCGSGRGLKALFDTARKLQPPTARSPLRNSRTGYGHIRCGASGCRVQRSLTPAKGN